MAPLAAAAAMLLAAGSFPARAGADADLGYELLVTNSGPEVPRTCYPAPGLPVWARGAFFISGPALFEMGGYHFNGLLDGYGRINRFELREGEVCYTSRWLNTGFWQQAHRHEGSDDDAHVPRAVLFEDTTPVRPSCPLLDPVCNLFAPNDNNWVNLIDVGGQAVLLSDTHRMVAMDFESLNCTGLKPWSDDETMFGIAQPDWVSPAHIPTSGSAHPLRRPGTHSYVDLVGVAPLVPFLEKAYIDLYTFEDTTAAPQSRKLFAHLEVEKNQYFHSFGVTKNYVVLPFNMALAMTSLTTPILMDAFTKSWKGLHLVDYEGRVQVFDTDPFFHVHIINTFENETGVVFDVGAYKDIPFAKTPMVDNTLFLNKTARDSFNGTDSVRRIHMHLAGPLKGTATYEDFWAGSFLDFFKINMAHSGLPYCIYYAVEWKHNNKDLASMAVVKHDLCSGTKKFWTRPHTYPGEPFFVLGPTRVEDDGAVVFIALDGQKGKSIFVTLKADTFEELSVVELPVHIPFTAHGQFVQDQVQAQEIIV